jgi:hypothetical protein
MNVWMAYVRFAAGGLMNPAVMGRAMTRERKGVVMILAPAINATKTRPAAMEHVLI